MVWISMALALLSPSAGGELGPCSNQVGSARAEPILEDLNAERIERDLVPLRLHPTLCAVASRRAEEIGRRGSLEGGVESVTAISRRLMDAGYEHHSWREATLHYAGGPEDLVATWRQYRPEDFEQMVSGDFLHLGVGTAELGGIPVYVLVATLPESVVFERRTEALSDLPAVRESVVAHVNRRRTERGLDPVSPDPRLHRAARRHAEEMLREGVYSHVGADGSSVRERLAAAGYRARRSAENIARGLFTPDEVVDRWMSSSAHRDNILDPRFEHVGVGVAHGEGTDGDGEVDWVQVFASPD